MPAMLSARRIGSAWPFARTRTAWSRARCPGLDPTPDLGGDPVGLLGTRRRTLRAGPARQPATTRCGAEPLDDARPDLEPVRVVEPDEPVGGVEDRRQRAVVPAQDDGPCPEVSVLEGEDVVDRGAAERVDRLVVVPDDGHIAVLLGERGDELGLGAVGVLELVDEDVAEAVGDLAPRGRRRPHEPEGQRDLVAEVDAPGRGHQVLIGRVRPRQLGLPAGLLVDGRRRRRRAASRTHGGLGRDAVRVRDVVRRRDVLVLAATEQRRQGSQEAGRVAERPVDVEVELEQVLAQEDDDLGTGQDAQIGRQPELERVLADEPVPEGVERADRRVRVAVRHELVDADRHLLGRLVGEGEGEDLRRPARDGSR